MPVLLEAQQHGPSDTGYARTAMTPAVTQKLVPEVVRSFFMT